MDTNAFAAISNESRRLKALEDMLASMDIINAAAPPLSGTVVLETKGANIVTLLRHPASSSPSAELSRTDTLRDMKAGRVSHPEGFNVFDLRQEIDLVIGMNRLHRLRGRSGVIDLHIFGNTWSLDANSFFGDLFGFDHPSACVVQENRDTRLLPDEIVLRVEFRPIEGAPSPSRPAMAALMAVLAGTAESLPSLQTRGVSGPLCDLGAAVQARPFDPNPQAIADCASRVSASAINAPVESCGKKGQLQAGIAPALETSPVHLVSRPDPAVVDRPVLRNDGLATSARVEASFGGTRFGAGPAPSLAAGRGPLALTLAPLSGCRPLSNWTASIADGMQGVQIVASRQSCERTIIQLGDITVR